MALPGLLKAGQPLSAGWLNGLVAEMRARTPRAGPGMRLTRTPSGTTFTADAGGRPAARTVVAAVVHADHGDPWGFSGETPDGTEDIYMLCLTSEEDIEDGTPLVALRTVDVAAAHSQGG